MNRNKQIHRLKQKQNKQTNKDGFPKSSLSGKVKNK